MLSGDILSQLSSLKKEIKDNRDTAQGTVRGTSGRYGFVVLDDGRDVFLKPEVMDHVFHGDRVEVLVTTKKTDAKEQYEGKLEKLIHSPLKQLAGRYCVRGKGHFVIVEQQQHTRWIFIPPKARANAKDGNYVCAKITQHPYETGKSQARITSDIGTDINIDNARKFSLALHQQFEGFPKDVEDAVQALQASSILIDKQQKPESKRTDLTNIDFVTIDSAGTRDMDDALAIEKTDDGWTLLVAIANPGSEITANSALDNIAFRRSQTLYLPGKPVPMLPEGLSTERYSLIANQDRLALVSKLTIDKKGNVLTAEFESAVVRSKAKLSYQQVSALLNNESFNAQAHLTDIAPFKDQLLQLQACTDVLFEHRKDNQLMTNNRDDFALLLNNLGKLESIEKIERTPAHRIVEESMIITNQCAGEFLAKHNSGLFLTHCGFKLERRDDIDKLLIEALGADKVGDTSSLTDYVAIIKQLQENDQHSLLLAKQQRFQQASELSLTATPHFNLGAQYYATITSPIRRYQDLYNQRIIHQLLANKKPIPLRPKQLELLKESVALSRSASRIVEQWLIADYMQDKIGQCFTGYIALLTNQGVGIRLHNTGIEGFVVAKKEDKENPDAIFDKLSFNNQRMELTWNENELSLDQEVDVKLTAIDMDKKKLSFEWII
jgi:exoribonuclease-2/ribonuclease R